MCLVLLLHDVHPDYRLIVAANRDEFYDRPTRAAAFWSEAPRVLAGRDLRAGGTWLGIDRSGRFAAVTNYRQREQEPPAARSRGHLVSDYLTGVQRLPAHLAQVERDAALYNGFNLLAADHREMVYLSNRGGAARHLAPGAYGLSNHMLDTPWPKVSAGKAGLRRLLSEPAAPRLVSALFDLLADPTQAADELLPDTGVGHEWERLLSSSFIASPDYGTRSSTVVLVGRDGRVTFAERSFAADGVPLGQEAGYTFAVAHGEARRE